MKRLIFIALALTLALAIVWVPAVSAEPVYPPEGNYPVEIIKTIPAGGPLEDFTFHGWRDVNNNFWLTGVIDEEDIYLGSVVIHGAGSGVLYSPSLGVCVVCEELIGGSAYIQQPCQMVQPDCVPAVFENELGGGPLGELVIVKVDGSGDPLAGACFTITPNPLTGADSLVLCDNDANDGCPEDGILCLSDCILDLVCTVEETTVPPGYEGADPQTVTISGLVELTFVNTIPGLCRITGGGTVGKGRDPRVTHGFELHCSADQLPNNLEVNWGGDHFHLLELTFVECWDDPAIDPKPPRAGCDTYHGIGMGRYNGVDGYQAEWVFTDAGEPGKKDWAWIWITDPDGNTVMEVSGFLKVGNQQFHDCTGKDLT